ncbi:MAG: glycosyl hydrolase family 95 catalytic domain-containing protein, partial [Eubacteriales bacterium]
AVSVDRIADDPLAYCREHARRPFDYDVRFTHHKNVFATYYNRTRLTLNASASALQQAYNMARYAAVSAGMPCNGGAVKAPINLQGLWNRDTRPAWESDYHLDLNIQMCYWPLPAIGLADFMEPFLAWMERLLPQARHCAADLYGASEGACYNGCSDPWMLGVTDNVGFGALGISAWLVQILWIYYEHNPRRELLDRIVPLMREIDAFYRSMLIRDINGHLTTPFGSYPEMSLMLGEHRQWLSSPSTFDLTLIREFYTDFAAAASLCGDTETENRCSELLSSLAEPVIADGILQEWTEPHIEGEPGHRHRSPFAAFCPGTLYTCNSHPEMTEAMERLLEKRLSFGSGMSTAFSYTWDAQIFARLGRGDDAYAALKTLLHIHMLDNLMLTTNDYSGKNGGIPWFTGIKVLQIEAQLALADAVTELFYQDMQGIIRLLPALPGDCPDGTLTCIHGRGGVVCDLAWKAGKLTYFHMTVQKDGIYRIAVSEPSFFLSPDGVWEDGVYVIRCQTGREYVWYGSPATGEKSSPG